MNTLHDPDARAGVVPLDAIEVAGVIGGGSFPRLILLEPSPTMLALASSIIGAAAAVVDYVVDG